MKGRLSPLQMAAMAVILLAGILSVTPIIQETTVFWFDMEDLDAGTKLVENIAIPATWILMILAVIRCGLLIPKNIVSKVIALVLGILSLAFLAVMPVFLAVSIPMGGLAGYSYTFNLLGWAAIVCNLLSILLTVLVCAKEH